MLQGARARATCVVVVLELGAACTRETCVETTTEFGVQGRLELTADSWVDVAVPAGSAGALESCQRLLEEERARFQGAPVAPRLVHPCASGRLPALPVPSGARVLVSPHAMSADDLALAAALSGDRRAVHAAGATVIDVTRFPTAEACEQARRRLVSARAEGQTQARQQAHEWLTEQTQRQKEQAAASCAEAERAKAACGALSGAERKVERALCEDKAAQAARACAMDQKLAELTQAKAAQPPAPEPSKGEPRCVEPTSCPS